MRCRMRIERATGEWLVFTDADVIFAPDLLRRTWHWRDDENWDHSTLLDALEMVGFWEVTMTLSRLGFTLGTQPWQVSDPKSAIYAGVGAFQLDAARSCTKLSARTKAGHGSG